MAMKLNPNKVGIRVYCETCGRRKAPRGRSVASELSASLCNFECPGYDDDPQAGSLWPGESEKEFGHPVGTVGTQIRKEGSV